MNGPYMGKLLSFITFSIDLLSATVRRNATSIRAIIDLITYILNNFIQRAAIFTSISKLLK